jgi:hypothetical protein
MEEELVFCQSRVLRGALASVGWLLSGDMLVFPLVCQLVVPSLLSRVVIRKVWVWAFVLVGPPFLPLFPWGFLGGRGGPSSSPSSPPTVKLSLNRLTSLLDFLS